MDKHLDSKETNVERNLIRFDWALKRLLRNKADYVVLEGFLSVLLGENVKIKSIVESEGNQTSADDKFNRVDIMVENDAKEIFIIEIQNCNEVDYFFRMLFGVSKAITDHIKIGEQYIRVRKVYHINIVYFDLGRGKDYVYHGTTSFIGIHYNDELQLSKKQQNFFKKETIPDLYPEYYILKVKDFDNYAKDNLDQWMYYLKNDAIPNNFTAPGLPEARERLLIDRLSPSERAEYDEHLMQLSHNYSMIHTAMDEGIDKGIKKGEEERRILQKTLDTKEKAIAQKDNIIANAIKSLIGQGLSSQQISQILQLDFEEVEKIFNK
jgi:predicted transposase/invertase (TIGR01784 family)